MTSPDSAPLEFEALYGAVYAFDDAGEEYERIVRRVYETVLRPGDVALDVGAHVGKHTIPMGLACGPQGRVVAMEPIPWAYAQLTERVARAGLGAVIHPLHGACADAEGEVTFSVVPSHPGWSSLVPRQGLTDVEPVTVSQTTVDLQAGDDADRVRFIKIDVEGAELLVLEGAQGTLARSRPVVHIEVVSSALKAFGTSVAQVAEPLQALGYRIFDLLGNDVTDPVEWDRSALAPALSDYIAIHPDDPAYEQVRTVLLSSFAHERLDRVSAPAGLAPPPVRHNPGPYLSGGFLDGGSPVPESFIRPLGAPAATSWPQLPSGDRGVLVLDEHPAVYGPATRRLLDVSTPTEVGLPLLVAPSRLPAGRSVLLRLQVPALPLGAHRTLVELRWHGSEVIALCRVHAKGRLEVFWLGAGGRELARRSVAPRGPLTDVEVEVWSAGGRVHLNLRAGGASAWCAQPLERVGSAEFDGAVGMRVHHPRPEPIAVETVRLSARSGARTVRARAAAPAQRLRAVRHPRSLARAVRARLRAKTAR